MNTKREFDEKKNLKIALGKSYRLHNFDDIVNYLIAMESQRFLREVMFSKDHNNKFSDPLLRNVVNADDFYYSAIIKITEGHSTQFRYNFMNKIFDESIPLTLRAEMLDFVKL
jgi:hypothetical protein